MGVISDPSDAKVVFGLRETELRSWKLLFLRSSEDPGIAASMARDLAKLQSALDAKQRHLHFVFRATKSSEADLVSLSLSSFFLKMCIAVLLIH